MHPLTFSFPLLRAQSRKRSTSGGFQLEIAPRRDFLERSRACDAARRVPIAVRFPIDHRDRGCFSVITGKFEAEPPADSQEGILFIRDQRESFPSFIDAFADRARQAVQRSNRNDSP